MKTPMFAVGELRWRARPGALTLGGNDTLMGTPRIPDGKLTPELLIDFVTLAKQDPSPVVRLALASAAGRLQLVRPLGPAGGAASAW